MSSRPRTGVHASHTPPPPSPPPSPPPNAYATPCSATACRGTRLAGPVIIEAMDSTTVIPPGWHANINDLGYIFLSHERAA